MPICPSVDQLCVHPHLPADALHTAFEQMRYPELFPDLAQIARNPALVLHDARAANHFQVRDLGQLG